MNPTQGKGKIKCDHYWWIGAAFLPNAIMSNPWRHLVSLFPCKHSNSDMDSLIFCITMRIRALWTCCSLQCSVIYNPLIDHFPGWKNITNYFSFLIQCPTHTAYICSIHHFLHGSVNMQNHRHYFSSMFACSFFLSQIYAIKMSAHTHTHTHTHRHTHTHICKQLKARKMHSIPQNKSTIKMFQWS